MNRICKMNFKFRVRADESPYAFILLIGKLDSEYNTFEGLFAKVVLTKSAFCG